MVMGDDVVVSCVENQNWTRRFLRVKLGLNVVVEATYVQRRRRIERIGDKALEELCP